MFIQFVDRLRFIAISAALLFLAETSLGAEPAPQRIVSINLCTDQMVLELAAPHQVRSVSFLARDPTSSSVAHQAARIPINRGGAEEILALNPDLVLAGRYTTRRTTQLLRKLGIKVVEFSPAQSIADVKEKYETIGALIGASDRAAAFNREIDAAVAAAQSTVKPGAPKLIFADYGVNGATSGQGSLRAELANIAGFTTLADELALGGARRISLEQLLHMRPDLLGLGESDYGAPALSTDALRHPALAYLASETPTVNIPGRLTSCGGVAMLSVLSLLTEKRQEILAP